jgi:hypothetical protein
MSRFVTTYQLLDCAALVNEANPVSVTVDGQGVAVTATIDTTALNNIVQKFAVTKAEDDALDSAARSQQAQE